MIKKLQAGDTSIPASGWNEMRAFIQDYSFPQDTFKSPPRNPAYISVKNVTSAALPALSIVKISTPIYTRTGDTFKNKGIEYGVEMQGNTPDSDSNNIAVIQEAIRPGCIGRAIVSGATPCIIHKATNTAYKYAKPVTSQTGYMEGTNDVTNYRVLWIASGTGNKEAFIICDASGTPTPEYFVINKGWNGSGTPPNTPSIFTKGSLHYVTWDGSDWIPHSANEATNSTSQQRPSGSKLVVCQTDAPTDAKDFQMPYFAPEDNLGVPPDFSDSVSVTDAGERCGVMPGEHEFTDKCYDYRKIEGSYIYEPAFVATVQAMGQTGGNNQLYIDINNEQYECVVPQYNPTQADNSGPSYPDIWPYDYMVVTFDCESYTASGLDYPRDYPEGTIIPCYRNWITGNPVFPGRGWQAYDPYDGTTVDIFTEYVNPNSPAYMNGGGASGIWVDTNGGGVYADGEKALVRRGYLSWIIKVKGSAIV